jgi:hypothetical protein
MKFLAARRIATSWKNARAQFRVQLSGANGQIMPHLRTM